MIALENKDSLEELVRSIAKDKDAKKEKAAEQKDNAETAAAHDVSKEKAQKMEKIRAALNHSDEETPQTAAPQEVQPAAKPVKPLKPLKPLKRADASAPNAKPETPKSDDKPEASDDKPKSGEKSEKTGDKPKKSGEKSGQSGNKPKKKSGKKGASKKAAFGPPALVEHGISYGALASVIGAALAISCVASYLIVAGTYKEKFLPNTFVNSIEISGMSVAEAEDTLIRNTEVQDLTLITHDGEEAVFPAADFGLRYSVPDGALDEAGEENPYAWIGKLFAPSEYRIDYNLYYDEEALRQLLDSYDWGGDVSQNACIVRQEDGSFKIQEETLGDTFNTDILLNYLRGEMSQGVSTITMEDSGCYEEYRAAIKYGDLTQELELYNNYARCTITFDFDDRTKVVTSDMIADWIMTYPDGTVLTDEEGKVQFDKSGVETFVAQMAAETDTVGKPRQFNSTLDGLIEVPWNGDYSSTYGWQINQTDTVAQLIDLMQAGETVTVEPVYSREGFCRKTDDIGDTYIDVDISAQHFWLYKDGQLVMDADFVSGTETNPDRRTPRGVCQILSRNGYTVLGTMEVQGYETPVNFWMPFNWLGCGFHDLGRGAYGGSIYMYNGSHGCLNLKYSVAEELYNTVEVGMPVLVHD